MKSLKQKHYKLPNFLFQCNSKNVFIYLFLFFGGKTHLQLISVKYQAYEICHGKAPKKKSAKKK